MTSGNDEGWFDGFAFDVMTPVRLHEHCINLRQIDGFSLIADGFDKSAEAEVFDGAEGAL